MNRKALILIPVIATILLGASCGKSNGGEETDTQKSASETTVNGIVDTQPAFTMSDYEVLGSEFVDLYPFQKFFTYETGTIEREPSDIKVYFFQNINREKEEPPSLSTARVKVTGFIPNDLRSPDEADPRISYYQIKVLEVYGDLTGYDLSQEYIIMYFGDPEIQAYRVPPLEIGREYLILNIKKPVNTQTPISSCSWLRIEKASGKEYVYPYFVDCSSLENNIIITDSAEAAIYTDSAILKYFEDNNIETPVFEYKFELSDFVAQVLVIGRQLNEVETT